MKKDISFLNKIFISTILTIVDSIFLTSMIFSKGQILERMRIIQEENLFTELLYGLKIATGFYDNSEIFLMPLTIWIYKFIGSFIPLNLLIDNPVNSLVYIQQINLACLFFICFCMSVLGWNILSHSKNLWIFDTYILCGLFLTISFIKVSHAGGLEFLSLIFIFIFLYYYQSVNKFKRNIAYFCLGFAGALKVYPLLFFLISKEKHPLARILLHFGILSIIPLFITGSTDYFIGYLLLLSKEFMNPIRLFIFIFTIVLCFLPLKTSENIKIVLVSAALGYIWGTLHPGVYIYMAIPLFLFDRNELYSQKWKYLPIVFFDILLLLVLLEFYPDKICIILCLFAGFFIIKKRHTADMRSIKLM